MGVPDRSIRRRAGEIDVRIKYIGSRPREIAGPRRLVVQPGEVFEVGDALGRSLLRQRRKFQSAPDPKPKAEPKTAPKATAEPEPDSTKENSDGNA